MRSQISVQEIATRRNKMLISKFDNTNIEKHISDYEAKYIFSFPAQYKEFLLKYNGGDTPDTKFKIGRVSSNLKGLYGLGSAGKLLNYAIFNDMDRIKDFLEDEMLPIGSNAFGDYITIGVGQGNGGKVFFLYHDRAKKYIELTEDFKTFVSKCKSEEIGNVMTIDERKALLIENCRGDKISQEKIDAWQAEIDKYTNIHQEELRL